MRRTLQGLSQADKDTLVRVRDFCNAVLKAKEAKEAELAGVICSKAEELGVTEGDLERVSKLMFAVADEMRERGWQ